MVESLDVSIPSSKGYHLAATLDLPDSTPHAFAIFSHCFAGSRYTPGAKRTSLRLAENGIAVLRFDFPGLGQSGGHFPDTSFSENVLDIVAVADWLTEHYQAPTLLCGHSLGGASAHAATKLIPSVKAVATIGSPPLAAKAVLRYLIDEVHDPLDPRIEWDELVHLDIHGAKVTVSGDFVRDLVAQEPIKYLHDFPAKLLLLHSREDHIVDFEQTAWVEQNSNTVPDVVEINDCDHLLIGPGTAITAADEITKWALPILQASTPTAGKVS